MDPNTDEEDMEDVIFDDKRQRHWSMVFYDNAGGVADEKDILNAKGWDVYMKKKKSLIKGGYYVEVSRSDRK